MSDQLQLKLFKDAECKIPLEAIEWDKSNYESGEVATATCYLYNESDSDYGIQKVEYPSDRRLIFLLSSDNFLLSSDKVYAHHSIRVTLWFPIPNSQTWNDLVKNVFIASGLKISGYFTVTKFEEK